MLNIYVKYAKSAIIKIKNRIYLLEKENRFRLLKICHNKLLERKIINVCDTVSNESRGV